MGAFRDMDAAPPTKGGGGTYRQMDKPVPPRTIWDDLTGGAQTFVRMIPGADEVNDAGNAFIKTAGDFATGRERATPRIGKGPFDDPVFKKNLAAERAKSKQQSEEFVAAHPVVGNLTKGFGMAATALPIAPSAGASLTRAAVEGAPTAARGLMGVAQKAGRLVEPSTKAAVTAGLMGNLTALADEGSLEERADAGARAVVPSMIFGAALPPAVSAGASLFNTAARLFSPAARSAPARAGRILASRAPEAIEPGTPPANDISLPFERMGRGGESLAKAVANVPGPGQEVAERVLNARRSTAPTRMLRSITRELGDDGKGFHPSLDNLDTRRKVESRPLYAEAYDQPAPTDMQLDSMLSRPSIQAARRRAIELAQEEGEDAYALGLYHMDDPAWDASDVPPDWGGPSDLSKFASRNPRPPSRGPSLMKFIADRGGIRGAQGELSAMDAQLWHRGKAYQRGIENKGPEGGDTLDGWALRAWEAGYFPEFRERPAPDDLIRAIRGEIAGQRRFAREPDQRLSDALRRRDEAEEMMYRGLPEEDLPTPDQYGGRPEPEVGPVQGETLNWRAWDYIKRGLDDVIEGERDPVTRKLPATDDIRTRQKTRAAMRRRLVELNPKYGEALQSYEGPSKQIDAMHLGRRLVSGKMDVEDVETGLGQMSADEVDALKLGIARGLSDQFRGENPQRAFRRFATDQLVQDRLRAGFGDEAAYGRFMRDIAEEVAAQTSYNRVLVGSRTTPLAQDIAAANEAASSGAERVADALMRRAGGETWRHQAVIGLVRNWERVRQPGLNNPEVSRLLAEALFESGDPQALLRAMVQAQAITPQEVRAVLPYLAAGSGELVAAGR